MRVVVIKNGLPPFEKKVEGNFIEFCCKTIGCRMVTRVHRKIGDQYYDIWADDEGLLKSGKKYINGYLDKKKCSEILCGTLVITKDDTKGLYESDVDNIIKHTANKNYILEERLGVDLDDKWFTDLEVEMPGYEDYEDLVIEKDGGLLMYEL